MAWNEFGKEKIVFKDQSRKVFQNNDGSVNWDKVEERYKYLKPIKQSIANKTFTHQVSVKARELSKDDQGKFLNILLSGLVNEDASVGAYVNRIQDYDVFSFFLQPLIIAYHGITGDTKQVHDWNIPVGVYMLNAINPDLKDVSMRARVARNVKGFNLPPAMDKQERLKFQSKMQEVFSSFGITGKYHSLTPGHKHELSAGEADKMRNDHYLFNDMTTDNHLTSSGVASDWPHGRGIWLSDDKTKMIWVGEQDQLRIISIVHGNDLGAVDASLHQLLTKMEKSGLQFAEHPVYGVITTCPTNMGTGKRQSILGHFPRITKGGQDQKSLKELAKKFGLQARGMGGQHSAMDKNGTADISPTARFGVTEAIVTQKLYEGLKKLYQTELKDSPQKQVKAESHSHPGIIFKDEARKKYLDGNGNVDWKKVKERWDQLKKIKTSLANKFFTEDVSKKANSMTKQDQHRLLDVMLGGLCNDDSSVGAYATRPEDYDIFAFYLEPLIREYHGINGDTKQVHDWNIPVGKYLLKSIDNTLDKVSMRARVARNVKGFNLPPSMDKAQRLKFQSRMQEVFSSFGITGKYHSLTPGHKHELSAGEADKMRNDHYLFNDMTTDNHLTSSGVASDWPHGRGIWLSDDKTKMIWVGEQDQLRIISIVHGNDLGAVDASLHQLLTKMEKSGLQFAEHPVYGVITTCPTNMGTGKRQSILGHFPRITKGGQDQKSLKELAKKFGLQARGMGGQHSAMDKNGTADISPTARFGVTEAIVTEKLYKGLKKLYNIQLDKHQTQIVFKEQARKEFLTADGNVDWKKVQARWDELKNIKISLANKFFTQDVAKKAKSLSKDDQNRLLDVMLGGLCNDDSSVGAYATRPEDYDNFSFYLEPLIREYHGITGDTKQQHDWNIPVGTYLLTKIDPLLEKVSMRARVARNVKGFNLPPSMDKAQRLKFQSRMQEVFSSFGITGKYHSLTPGHKHELSAGEADKMRNDHYLFNDMTTDNHLTSSGVASDWPHGRGIWLSDDKTKMIWVGEQDQLRIISIVHGNDLGAVDASLHQLLTKMEKSGLQFAEHPVYGVITTCPTNMGTGKRQSILGHFPRITKGGQDQKSLKELAKKFGLQARGMGGQHSAMDKNGTADISPTARFGVTEAIVTQKLYDGLTQLVAIQLSTQYSGDHCCLIM